MSSSKSGGLPRKKKKTLLSGKKAAKADEEEETGADKAAQEFENRPEDKAAAELKSWKTQEEADLELAKELGAFKFKPSKSGPELTSFEPSTKSSFATGASGFSFGGASNTGFGTLSTGTKKKPESFADCVEVRVGGKVILNENQKKKLKRESAAARGKETLFFGAAPPPETLEELSFETPKPKKANKVPLGQYESPIYLTPMPLVWHVEESPDFKDMLKEQSISVRQDAEIIEKIPSKRYKSLDSWFNDAKTRKDLHPLVIMKIIATIESLQSMKLKSKVKNSPKIEKGLAAQIKNIPDVIYWYDRLLPLLQEDGSEDYGIALSLKGRLLYYEPIDDDIPNNDLSKVELEDVLDLKKQLVDVQPIDVHYLSIATTFIQLERWAEAITYSKKGIRVGETGDVATLLSLYGRLIEAQVKSNCYEDAMGTFKKLKKFNLNSQNAQDVDVKTPISAAKKLLKFVEKSDDLNAYLAANLEAFDFKEDKNAIKIVNRLGNLCEWRSKIFQAFAGPKEPGWKGWKQMPPTIFADLGANRKLPAGLAGKPVVQLWQPQDEACFRRLCMVNRELQYDWLKVAYSLYKFHWDEAGDFVMCNKHILGDLVERIIHAACMIYVHEMQIVQKKAGDYMVSTNPTNYYYKEGESTKEELMLAPKKMLEIMLPLIGKLNEHDIEFAPFLPKTVKRFSISTENVLFFIDGLTIFLKWNQDGAEPLTPYKESLKPLLAYKNSLSINSHFMSRFCVEEE